jgi:RNA polymerase subunit RPABC4/transcription elongation factor Spt4
MRDEDVVEVVRCKDCDVPHNRWTGCPNLNGMIPPPDFYCAKGERKQKTDDVPDISVGDKQPCKVCEKITEANKDIFWVFARTHQPGTREEFLRIPYEETRFCPVCGREITKEGADGGQ